MVATVPTACGIETLPQYLDSLFLLRALQQCLPLAVLKQNNFSSSSIGPAIVATVPTACGIETRTRCRWCIPEYATVVATVPTACGIETPTSIGSKLLLFGLVATVPTACGIETPRSLRPSLRGWLL